MPALATLAWLVVTFAISPASAATRDGFDPGVVDAATGEPLRQPFPGTRPTAASRQPAERENESRLEAEDSHYQRWLWFWSRRADHAGALDLDRTWNYFRNGRPRRFATDGAVPAAEWASLGPNTMQGVGGRMLCATFHPDRPETLYAGSNSGGLWRSLNGGASWDPLTDQLPAMSVSSVAVNPSNPDEMLVGTGWGWFLATSGYAGVGVLRSTDGGATWNPTSFSYPIAAGIGTFDLAWDPVKPGRVHLAANNGYWRSDDGGVSWTLRKGGFCTALLLHPQKPDTVYFAFGNDGFYQSPNGGTSFNKLTNGLPADAQIFQASLAICRDQPNVLVTMVTNPTTFCSQGLYRSTNNGQSWSAIGTAPDPMTLPGLGTCYGWLFNTVSLSPSDPNRILIGGLRVFRTQNGGSGWVQRDYYAQSPSVNPDAGFLYVDNFQFLWHPNDPNVVYGFNDGGVWKSSNGGTFWRPKSEGLITGLFYTLASAASRPDVLVGGAQDQGVVRLDHAGGNQRWTRWVTGDGGAVNIDPANDQVVYGSVNFGVHMKSLAGAATFESSPTQINTGLAETSRFLSPTVMDPQNPSVLWTATVSRIYKTTDGGGLWTASASIPNVVTLAVDHVDPQVVYAHAYDNSTWQLWRTLNGGASWVRVLDASIPGWRVTDLETDPTQSGVVYATRNSGFAGQDHVKRSADFGATWTDITSNLPDIATSAIAVSAASPAHLYVATDLGVFLSTDTGASWNEWNDGLPLVYATDLHYLAADHTVRVATMGRGVWKSRAHDAVVSVEPDGAGGGLALSVRPNPSRGASRIQFALARGGNTAVEIFDLTGQRVRTLARSRHGAGTHELTWDGRDARGAQVPAGVFFVRVTSEGRSRTARALRL